MSRFNSPIPVQTNLLNGQDLSIPWKKWFKDIGDDWVMANKILTKPTNFNYTINGSTIFFSFTGTIETIIDLPYIVGVDSVINGVVISKGTKTITLSTPTSGFYFAQF